MILKHIGQINSLFQVCHHGEMHAIKRAEPGGTWAHKNRAELAVKKTAYGMLTLLNPSTSQKSATNEHYFISQSL